LSDQYGLVNPNQGVYGPVVIDRLGDLKQRIDLLLLKRK
jgi:hypothetical protein